MRKWTNHLRVLYTCVYLFFLQQMLTSNLLEIYACFLWLTFVLDSNYFVDMCLRPQRPPWPWMWVLGFQVSITIPIDFLWFSFQFYYKLTESPHMKLTLGKEFIFHSYNEGPFTHCVKKMNNIIYLKVVVLCLAPRSNREN